MISYYIISHIISGRKTRHNSTAEQSTSCAVMVYLAVMEE